jgi:hypothetical protein
MITPEEEDRIINKAVEKTLLAIPEVVGNLIMSQIDMVRLNKSFYESNPEFKTSKELVASLVEKIENENPGLKYEEILSRAVPFIKERIASMKNLDVAKVTKPSRDLSSIDFNGEL